MYHENFGLTGPPFQANPTLDAIYLSSEHREGLALIEWGMKNEPSGLTVLVGETGTGKTTLMFAALGKHFAKVRAAYIGNPKLPFDEIMCAAFEQLGIQTQGKSKRELIASFEASLDRLGPDERIALLFDEAQELSDEALEEIRLLSNVDTAATRRLEILLIGQPELADRLSAPKARSLNGRIGARAILNPMKPAEAVAYVQHRLRQKGGDADRIFTRRTLDYLLAHAGGFPRRINVLCHNAMLLAYGKGQMRVDLSNAKEAVAEYDNFFSAAKHPARSRVVTLPSVRLLSALIVIGVLGAAMARAYVASASHARTRAQTMSKVRNAPSVNADLPAKPKLAENFAPTKTPILLPAEVSYGATAKVIGPAAAQPRSRTTSALRQVRVRREDTLTEIASRYLGSPQEVNRLITANPQLKDANRIYPGQIINLPAASPAVTQR